MTIQVIGVTAQYENGFTDKEGKRNSGKIKERFVSS